MVSKSTSKEMDGGPPPLDENWWRALLADEEKACSVGARQAPYSAKPKKDHRVVDIDWEHAQHVYAVDDLIELQVTSYNRGGLLVEGEDLHGFVPISHLVDLPGTENEEDREQFLAAYVAGACISKSLNATPSVAGLFSPNVQA